MPKATTVRFTDEMFARLDQASARTGMPVNSIVIAACLEWMQRHTPTPGAEPGPGVELTGLAPRALAVPPRWATLRRAVELAVGKRTTAGMYPFERFTPSAQKLLTVAQTEALKAGLSYIGTEHMLLAAFGDAGFQSAKLLAAMGIEEVAVRSALDKLLDKKKKTTPTKIIPTARVKKVIELASPSWLSCPNQKREPVCRGGAARRLSRPPQANAPPQRLRRRWDRDRRTASRGCGCCRSGTGCDSRSRARISDTSTSAAPAQLTINPQWRRSGS